MNFSGKNLEKNSGEKNFLIHIITRKIPRGVLATRVFSREPLEINPKTILRKILTKKFRKKNWNKNLKKILGKKIFSFI